MCRKYNITIMLFAIFAAMVLLSACGSKEPRRGIDGYLYTASELPLEGGSRLKFRGGYLYYQDFTSPNDPADNTVGSLYRISEENLLSASGTEGIQNELVVEVDSNVGKILEYALDDTGAVYYCLAEMEYFKNSETEIWEAKVKNVLIKKSEDGREIYRRPLDLDANTSYEITLAVDEGGWVFLLVEDTVHVFDMEGNLAGELDMGEYHAVGISASEKLAEGADGRVYYVWKDDGRAELAVYEILKENAGSGTNFRLERLTAFNEEMRAEGGGYGTLFGSFGGLLYNDKDGILKQYQSEDGSFRELLRWSDSSLIGNPHDIIWISEECLIAYFPFEEKQLYLLTKKDVGEVPEKEELTLAIRYPSFNLEQRVAEFNRENERYHITLTTYITEEQQTRLDAELVSSNPPDLLDLTYMDAGKYAEKGLLEDLAPYLEGSGVLDMDAYWDSIREGYTVNGRLICLPRSFTVFVLMGRESLLGSLEAWDMEAIITLSEEYPEGRLMGMDNFQYVLEELCSDYILEQYIDWENGTCTFDQKEFGEFMMWLEEHTDGWERIASERDYQGGIVPEDILLLKRMWHVWFDPMRYDMIYQGDMYVAGYPSQNGRTMYQGYAFDLIGIASKSAHKDGAWEFLEYYLSYPETEYDVGFPAQKELFVQMLEEQMTPEYYERKNPKQGEEPIEIRAKSSFVMDGEAIDYYYLTPEQAELLQDIAEHTAFSLNGGVRAEVINIIMEEMDGYFKGEKTLEETTTVIQNRVQILVQERM